MECQKSLNKIKFLKIKITYSDDTDANNGISKK